MAIESIVMTISGDGGACTLDPTGLHMPDGLGFDDWAKVGSSMRGVSRALLWWIGDWLNYGVKAYGDKRALAVDHAHSLGMGSEAVRQAMWVSEQVVTRVTTLSWAHHREVAALEPKRQAHWLTKADAEGWSVAELRQAIRADAGNLRHEPNKADGAFNTQIWALDFSRWAKAEDPKDWPQERRELIKKDLEPIVEFYGKL